MARRVTRGESRLVVNDDQRAALTEGALAMAPVLARSMQAQGGSIGAVGQMVGESSVGRSLEQLGGGSMEHLGVSTFTDSLYGDGGIVNPGMVGSLLEDSGIRGHAEHLVNALDGEGVMEKLEGQYARSVDKVTDFVEQASPAQIAMMAQAGAYLSSEEPIEPVADVADAGADAPDMFQGGFEEPETDDMTADLHELDVEEVGQMAVVAGTSMPNVELSTPEVTIEHAEEECCTCCAYEDSGQVGDCGFCDCEDDAQGECDDCMVM